MECSYFEADRCRSCTLIPTRYDEQLSGKVAHAHSLVDAQRWLAPVRSAERGFRNKAKMVVGGSVDAPTLGILDARGTGVDLQDCPLYPPAIAASFGPLAHFVSAAGLVPYDVTTRRGELKLILVTGNEAGELMVRFVLRSTEALARVRKHVPSLQSDLPGLVVASVNILPEHRAVTEGETEILLTERETLPMLINGVPLSLRPQSFFQTNTEVAAELYRQAAAWIDGVGPRSVWDLYCGVGGFALHALAPGRSVTGVELNGEATRAAQQTAAALASQGVGGADGARFLEGDATAFAVAHALPPDVVIVNPPRRGIGPALAAWLECSGVATVVYSSCNTESFARDLAEMPAYGVAEARVLDMFPHTPHYELAAILRRR